MLYGIALFEGHQTRQMHCFYLRVLSCILFSYVVGRKIYEQCQFAARVSFSAYSSVDVPILHPVLLNEETYRIHIAGIISGNSHWAPTGSPYVCEILAIFYLAVAKVDRQTGKHMPKFPGIRYIL